MKRKPVFLLLAFMLFLPAAFARSSLTFQPRRFVWHATHIVIATEREIIDGELTVIESWYGDLKPGEFISVPGLAEFAEPETRRIRGRPPPGTMDAVEGVEYVTGNRMILFLKRLSPGEDDGKKSGNTSGKWDPAYSQSMKFNAAWVEKDRVFAFGLGPFSDGCILCDQDFTEGKLRSWIEQDMRDREELEKAIAIENPSERAAALKKHAYHWLLDVYRIVFKELEKCGTIALPVLRELLEDESISDRHDEIVDVFARVGGNSVEGELVDMLAAQLRFWERNTPGLRDDWLCYVSRDGPCHKYDKTLHILGALKTVRSEECETLVTELRNLWSSVPKLTQYKSVVNACDAILRQLGRSAGEQKNEPPKEDRDSVEEDPYQSTSSEAGADEHKYPAAPPPPGKPTPARTKQPAVEDTDKPTVTPTARGVETTDMQTENGEEETSVYWTVYRCALVVIFVIALLLLIRTRL